MRKIYDFVMERLTNTPLTYQEVGHGSTVSKRTVEKIARREILDPGVSHCQNIAGFFEELDRMPGANERERFEQLIAQRRAVA